MMKKLILDLVYAQLLWNSENADSLALKIWSFKFQKNLPLPPQIVIFQRWVEWVEGV